VCWQVGRRAASIAGAAAQDVTATLADGASPDPGVRDRRRYRIARYKDPDTIVSVAAGDGHDDLFQQLDGRKNCHWALENRPLMGASKPAS
jgi:hypothetical protein